MITDPPNFRMTRSDYMAELGDLVVALLQRHGPMSVRSLQELANQVIVTQGITGSGDYVRSLPPVDRRS